jgi:hypothetical protein
MRNDERPEQFDEARHQRITERAFARFEARGGLHGHDVEDWLEAEREEADAESAREAQASTPLPGLTPRQNTGNAQRDEESRRAVERDTRAIHREAQRQLVR